MILKEKFHNAYVSDSYTKQYENYQKIADEYALAFGIYLEAASGDMEFQREIKSCLESFKRTYNSAEKENNKTEK